MRFLTITALLACAMTASAQKSEIIRVNQVGYYPNQEQVAVIEGAQTAGLAVVNDKGKVMATPKVVRNATSVWSGKTRTVIDMGHLPTGNYTLQCGGEKMPFVVKSHPWRDLSVASIKLFYMMRTGVPIEEQYAGHYAREAAHPDTHVMIHPSAASPARPAGTVISSPKGWYDAGDYNKYVVNSSFSIGMMLASYEQNKGYFDKLKVNIPESKNKTADLLDEIMFNMEWLLTMQDPSDGGVYHKLTDPNFDAFVMPRECKQQRYVVAKSTAATLDFAAVMAQMARIMKGNKDYPGFAELAREAAVKAYAWAKANPERYYLQNEMNQQYEPKVFTGDYGDGKVKDEFFWAATQLYLLTHDGKYRSDAIEHYPDYFIYPTWGSVGALGSFAWLASEDAEMKARAAKEVKEACDKLVALVPNSCYQSPNGNRLVDFGWGCLAESFCSPALTMLFADRFIDKGKYIKYAMQNMDYILGRNALGYCYVTGFGQKSPMHPHHRISEADGIVSPMPGMLVGGPNNGQQDNVTYHSLEPDEAYEDVMDSYASNEIAINWNASMVAAIGWIDAAVK